MDELKEIEIPIPGECNALAEAKEFLREIPTDDIIATCHRMLGNFTMYRFGCDSANKFLWESLQEILRREGYGIFICKCEAVHLVKGERIIKHWHKRGIYHMPDYECVHHGEKKILKGATIYNRWQQLVIEKMSDFEKTFYCEDRKCEHMRTAEAFVAEFSEEESDVMGVYRHLGNFNKTRSTMCEDANVYMWYALQGVLRMDGYYIYSCFCKALHLGESYGWQQLLPYCVRNEWHLPGPGCYHCGVECPEIGWCDTGAECPDCANGLDAEELKDE